MIDLTSKNESERFYEILKTALITSKKTKLIWENLKAITFFESKLHYESSETIFQIEKKNLQNKNKIVENQVDKNSLELAMSYLPYWDTQLMGQGKKQPEDSKTVKEWFQLAPADAFMMCMLINCNTFRDFISYYRTNQRLYTANEVKNHT